ncbi:hypothetical protein ABTB61_19375, partial [Acinetobacter baumannii]
KKPNRRSALKVLLTGSAALVAAPLLPTSAACSPSTHSLKNNIQHAVCRWCFNDLTVDQLCIEAKKMGIKGIDLVGPKDWPTLQKHGLVS